MEALGSLVWFALCMLLLADAANAVLVANQRNALVQIYNSLNGPSWTNYNWQVNNNASDGCTW